MEIRRIEDKYEKDWGRRSKMRILIDILRLIRRKGGVVKITHILYGANLSYKRMKEYLDWLEMQGFIQMASRGENKCYSLTKKGESFIAEFKKIEEISQAFGIEI